MKDVAKYLPGIGWTFLFMEYPLLKRDWTHDQSCLVKACENLKDYPVNMLVRMCAFVLDVCASSSLLFQYKHSFPPPPQFSLSFFNLSLSPFLHSCVYLQRVQGSQRKSTD